MTTPPQVGLSHIAPAEDVEGDYALAQQRLHLGKVGGFFGGANAPSNIAGLVVLALTAACVAVPFFQTTTPPLEYLKIVAPIITLILGYLFGEKRK